MDFQYLDGFFLVPVLYVWVFRGHPDPCGIMQVFETFFANCEQSQLFLRAANKRLMYIMGRLLGCC